MLITSISLGEKCGCLDASLPIRAACGFVSPLSKTKEFGAQGGIPILPISCLIVSMRGFLCQFNLRAA
jgi:hypothetical protein